MFAVLCTDSMQRMLNKVLVVLFFLILISFPKSDVMLKIRLLFYQYLSLLIL